MICDGYTMNASLRYLPFRYYPLALEELRFLRQSGGRFRCKLYCAPLDINGAPTTLAAFDTIPSTLHITPGSWLWGFNFSSLNGNAISANSDCYVEVADPCQLDAQGNPFKIFGSSLISSAVSPTGASGLYPMLLTKPRFIPQPGQITVTLTNRINAVRNVQLVLHTAEPCQVVV